MTTEALALGMDLLDIIQVIIYRFPWYRWRGICQESISHNPSTRMKHLTMTEQLGQDDGITLRLQLQLRDATKES